MHARPKIFFCPRGWPTSAIIPPLPGHARFRDRASPATAKSGILHYLLCYAATRGHRVGRSLRLGWGGGYGESTRIGWGFVAVPRPAARGPLGAQAPTQ